MAQFQPALVALLLFALVFLPLACANKELVCTGAGSAETEFLAYDRIQACLGTINASLASRLAILKTISATVKTYAFQDLDSPGYDRHQNIASTSLPGSLEMFLRELENTALFRFSSDFNMHEGISSRLSILKDLGVIYEKPKCYFDLTMKQPFLLNSKVNENGHQVIYVEGIDPDVASETDWLGKASEYIDTEVVEIDNRKAIQVIAEYGDVIGFSKDLSSAFNAALRLFTSRNLGLFNFTGLQTQYKFKTSKGTRLDKWEWRAMARPGWAINQSFCSISGAFLSKTTRQDLLFRNSLQSNPEFLIPCWHNASSLEVAGVVAGVKDGVLIVRFTRFPISPDPMANYAQRIANCSAAFKTSKVLLDFRTVIDSPESRCSALELVRFLSPKPLNLAFDVQETKDLIKQMKTTLDTKINDPNTSFIPPKELQFLVDSALINIETGKTYAKDDSSWWTPAVYLPRTRESVKAYFSQKVRLASCEKIADPMPSSYNDTQLNYSVAIVSDGLCSGLCARIAYLIQNNTNATLYAIGGNASIVAMSYAVSPGGISFSSDLLATMAKTLGLNESFTKLARGSFQYPITEVFARAESNRPLEYDFFNLDSDKHLPLWWPEDELLYKAVLEDLGWWKREVPPVTGRLDLPTSLSLGAAVLFVIINGGLAIIGGIWSKRIHKDHERRHPKSEPIFDNEIDTDAAASRSGALLPGEEYDEGADVTSHLI